MSQSKFTDQQVEQAMGRLLQAGVILAATVVLIGGVIFLWRNGAQSHDLRTFEGEPDQLRSVGEIVEFAASGRGRGIIQLGLLLLVLTPISRVLFSVYAFARQRDLCYVVLTLIVLSLLLFSLITGR